MRRLAGQVLLYAVLAGCAGWAALATGRGLLDAGAGALAALSLLPVLIGLHLFQLFLSAIAWRSLLPASGLARFYQLRIVREGIDSLLPVAQVGGEVVGARLLAGGTTSLAASAASVVVDVTVEFLTQLGFLLLGVAALAVLSPGRAWQTWLGALAATAAAAAGLLAAQRFGVLRALEALARQIAARWPGAAALAGLDTEAAAIYRRTRPMAAACALHLLAWLLGTIESWAVLRALGASVSPGAALVVESLGMAARSAGFAVPGALVVQEAGFALAAAAIGLPAGSGLALSLIKRAREVAVGLVGLALWRLEAVRSRNLL